MHPQIFTNYSIITPVVLFYFNLKMRAFRLLHLTIHYIVLNIIVLHTSHCVMKLSIHCRFYSRGPADGGAHPFQTYDVEALH